MDATNYTTTPMESGIKFSKDDWHDSPIDKAHMSPIPIPKLWEVLCMPL